MMAGEYNFVVFPNENADRNIKLPNLVDGVGNTVSPKDVVIRVTRPDASKQPNGGIWHRYKPLDQCISELSYCLHGAVHGYAPEVYAAVVFPAVVGDVTDSTTMKHCRQQLYGILLVMRRAQADVNTLMAQRTREILVDFDTRDGVSSTECTLELQSSGRKVAFKILETIVRQSKLGVLSFDAKPANYVFGYDAKVKAVDFDSAMYTLVDTSTTTWLSCLLMNLLLVTAHVRCYRNSRMADGWTGALRCLLLDLCKHARGATWLFSARLRTCDYREIHSNTLEAATERFEIFSSIYFASASKGVVTAFDGDFSPTAPPLVYQLLRFGLHAASTKPDRELDAAFGRATGTGGFF